MRSGDPLNESTQIGAIVTEKHYQTVLGYIEQGKNEGATLLTGGKADLAQGSGKDAAGIDAALGAVRAEIGRS